MRAINEIFIHESDSEDVSAETIRQWHLERGWSDIGYHYVLHPSGMFELGRPIAKPGAHVKGRNSHSIGICLTGRDKTKAQFKELKKLLRNLMDIFDLKPIDIIGHNEVNPNKTCPGFDVKAWVAENFKE